MLIHNLTQVIHSCTNTHHKFSCIMYNYVLLSGCRTILSPVCRMHLFKKKLYLSMLKLNRFFWTCALLLHHCVKHPTIFQLIYTVKYLLNCIIENLEPFFLSIIVWYCFKMLIIGLKCFSLEVKQLIIVNLKKSWLTLRLQHLRAVFASLIIIVGWLWPKTSWLLQGVAICILV